jgi:hypothetical protein
VTSPTRARCRPPCTASRRCSCSPARTPGRSAGIATPSTPHAGRRCNCWCVARSSEPAAVILAQHGHAGAHYDVTGPEALSYADVAAKLSNAMGRRITYVAAPDDAVRQALLRAGLNEWFAQALVGLSGLPPLGDRRLRRPGQQHRGAAHRPPAAVARQSARRDHRRLTSHSRRPTRPLITGGGEPARAEPDARPVRVVNGYHAGRCRALSLHSASTEHQPFCGPGGWHAPQRPCPRRVQPLPASHDYRCGPQPSQPAAVAG